MYPAILAGLALSAAGTGMQMAASSKAKGAMNDAQNAELLRQRGYQEQADASFQQNLAKSKRDTADTEQQAGADRRTAEYGKIAATGAGVAAPITQTTSGNATPNSAAGAAARNKSTVTATGNAWSKLVGNARAKLGGGDDWQLNQSIRNTRANQDLAITAGNARASANILPVEMNAASHEGDALKGWGQLVGALGAVTGMAGSVAGAAPVAGGNYAAELGRAAAAEGAQAAGNWSALTPMVSTWPGW